MPDNLVKTIYDELRAVCAHLDESPYGSAEADLIYDAEQALRALCIKHNLLPKPAPEPEISSTDIPF